MAVHNTLEQITDRVERLLTQQQSLQESNLRLAEEMRAIGLERDALKQRLGAALGRIDALLEQLPQTGEKK